MNKYCILYNYYSGLGLGYEYAKEVENLIYSNEYFYQNMLDVNDYKKFLKEHKEDLIICGGDGTLNFFINATKDIKYNNKVFYYPTGNGNDFHNDMSKIKVPYDITDELKKLPTALINGKDYVFLNGVGGGLDGFACKEVILKKRKRRKGSYTLEALKALLYKYNPSEISITVDNKKYDFKDAWMVSVMHGRYYGGGMMLAPKQKRKKDKLTVVILYSKHKFTILKALTKVFNGEHTKYKKVIKLIEGQDITINFSNNEIVQLDGEIVEDVKSFNVKVSNK